MENKHDWAGIHQSHSTIVLSIFRQSFIIHPKKGNEFFISMLRSGKVPAWVQKYCKIFFQLQPMHSGSALQWTVQWCCLFCSIQWIIGLPLVWCPNSNMLSNSSKYSIPLCRGKTGWAWIFNKYSMLEMPTSISSTLLNTK